MATSAPRHTTTVRVTHWVTTLCFFALLLSGVELVISHPRFYWGETGNVNTEALFQLPIPSSRAAVKTGYSFVLPDQNGWSRSLHFQSAWGVVIAGLCYVVYGLRRGHFRWSYYNQLQRVTYLVVVFGLFPLMIWTGLAMSPAVTSAFPVLDAIWGGRQSARTVHFLVTVWLVLFLMVHVVKVYSAGFRKHTGAMITGRVSGEGE